MNKLYGKIFNIIFIIFFGCLVNIDIANTMYIEKEIKFNLNNVSEIIKTIKKLNMKFIGSAEEKTIRYDDENNSYSKRKKFWRLRSGFENVITLKEDIENSEKESSVSERIETETTVGDLEKMSYILNQLGLKEKKIMVKFRAKWQFKNAEVVIDELPFGFFLEIEGSEKEIFEVACLLNLDINKKITGTYWTEFDNYKNNHTVIDKYNIIFPKDYIYKLPNLLK